MTASLALIALGAAGLSASIFLLVRGDPLIRVFFYLPAWWSYLTLAAGVNRLRRGRCLLVDRPRTYLRMAAFSVPAWLYYEAVNFRVRNWEYWELPEPSAVRWAGYVLAFATVLPAIHDTAGLFADEDSRSRPLPSLADGRLDGVYLSLGLACLALPLIWPKYCFPLIWGAIFFLLEPWLARNAPTSSWLAAFAAGRRNRVYSLLLSGLACGLLWEALNFWAGAKWKYTVPWPTEPKLFEMPLLGFLGFPPFALGCATVWSFFNGLWERSGPVLRLSVLTALAAMSLAIFRGMDIHTVQSTVPLPGF